MTLAQRVATFLTHALMLIGIYSVALYAGMTPYIGGKGAVKPGSPYMEAPDY